ncbi:MAG: hypothetical protein KKE05_04675, partial [Nanoarchaeota archaeon]|nr:hypothetical protein [Nanoarchaeota archaeon]
MFGISNIPISLLVAAGVVVALIFIFRSTNQSSVLSMIKRNFFYFFLFLFIAIFVITAININSTYSFDFTTLDGWRGLFKVYLSWFGSVLSNLAK